MAEEQQGVRPMVCLAHSGHEQQLETLTESMRVIKRMFWLIILLLVTSIVRPNIASFFETHTTTTHAEEVTTDMKK